MTKLMNKSERIKLPNFCKMEFGTVALLLNSEEETRAVDAFIISWTKYEKQLRKLLCFLLFQNSAITEENLDSFNNVIINNKKLYPNNIIQAINDLRVGNLSDWVGKHYESLAKELNEIGARRNKLIHGQTTGEKLSACDLVDDVSTILKWVQLLGRGSKKAVKYDGLMRNTFRRAKTELRSSKTEFPFRSPKELDLWLRKFTHPKKR